MAFPVKWETIHCLNLGALRQARQDDAPKALAMATVSGTPSTLGEPCFAATVDSLWQETLLD